MLAPICLFTYKRLDTLMQTVSALQKNYLAADSELYIFSDGAKSESDSGRIEDVRNYLRTITGFKKIVVKENTENKGLANSIIEGVSEIINQYGKVIVLEDDLVSSANFLNYMNDALEYYKDKDRMFSIAGYTPPIKNAKHDIYFTKRASSWGWATWSEQWNAVDWDVNNYKSIIASSEFKKSFNRMGSDMTKMLNDQIMGKINSWAIRWGYNQYLMDKFTVYPTISKIQNIGTGSDATHTADRFNRFFTPLDITCKTEFEFGNPIILDDYYLKQFLKQYSVYARIKYKVLNNLFKL